MTDFVSWPWPAPTLPPHVHQVAACRFYERVAVDDGWRYEPLTFATPTGDSALHTTNPPAAGDLVHLPSATYRVVARAWLYPAYGSAAWRYDSTGPDASMLTVVVERTHGPFTDEAPLPEDAPEGEDTGEAPDLGEGDRDG